MVDISEYDMGEASMSMDVQDMAEGSISRDVQDVNNDSLVSSDNEEQSDETDIELYELDPEFFPTPKGTPYWVPDVPEDEKPKIGHIFDSFDAGYNMYHVYSQKSRFDIKKSGQKRYKGQITHRYVLCNRAGKPRKKVEKNTLKEGDEEDAEKDGEKDGQRKRKRRRTVSKVTNCPARIVLKAVPGTQSYKVNDFVENHNHPLMNENNMDLSRARRQLKFGDYIFIHRASLSNLGPTKAHKLKVALMGGFDKVRGTPMDWRNFRRAVNSFIGERDAQMLVDKMINRKKHVPQFSFEYHTDEHNELVSLFWADETMKCNYVAFGDVVSFDATFRTNKYYFVFVPFTGIDHHQKCVTFGAALLENETYESYCWMLEAFLKVHVKQPPLALTDQDAALRKAIVTMFPETQHRLCMWHITEKLPGKVLGDLEADSNFRKDFHKLIWNVYIGPEVFEERWNALITRYNLHDNKWLSDMYAIRDRWIPGYFSQLPMCGLMKTTSRSESSNAFFQIYSHEGNTLVQFMLCFESAMEKQRYTQRVLDNKANGSTLAILTELPIEQHACDVYTPSIFIEVQHEIHKGLYACSQISAHSEGSVENCIIRHRDKRSNKVIDATVILDHLDGSVKCSCGHYNRHGYLCRHVFCVFRIHDIHRIPNLYLNRRWTKNVLPIHLLDKRHRYGPCIEETDRLASDIHATIEDCIGLIRTDTDKLAQFLSTVRDLKKQLEVEVPTPDVSLNKEELYADLLGVTVPKKVVIKITKKNKNKGSGRIKSASEVSKGKKKVRTNRKVPFKQRTCSICGVKGHNRLTCPEAIVEEDDEDEEGEDDEEDEFNEEEEVDDEDGDGGD